MNRSFVICCCLLVASACAEATEDTSDPLEEEFAGITLSGLGWSFTWDVDGIDSSEGGWSTTNDQGVTFTVESGWLSSYSAALAPCVAEEETEWARRGLIERLLGIGTALADHAVDIDPSALADPILEDLAGLQSSDSVPLSFSPTDYCQLHYLIARADAETTDPAPGVPMSLVTLRLNGHWTDGEDGGDLQVESSFNYGALFSLEGLAESPPGGQAQIEIRRKASLLFSGIEPNLLSENELGWQITKNLVDSSKFLFEEADFSDEI
jgi:hypothetical protein